MRARSIVAIGCISLLAFGSVVALAQSAPEEATSEAAPPTSATEPTPIAAEVPPPPDSQNSSVEDAPVDVPTSPQSDWAPDINLDAQNQADALNEPARRTATKPRKVLSDAGETMLGTNGWRQANDSASAQAQLLSRASRRERPIDPVKRSDLTKLSRIMGALHALRVSCTGRDDQTYRSRMATMLDLEAPGNGDLRDPLVDAFNGGFQAYGRGAGSCPGDARGQEANLAKEGFTLARTMSARYRTVPKVVAELPPATQPRVNALPAASAKAAAPTPQTPPTRANWQTNP